MQPIILNSKQGTYNHTGILFSLCKFNVNNKIGRGHWVWSLGVVNGFRQKKTKECPNSPKVVRSENKCRFKFNEGVNHKSSTIAYLYMHDC